MSEIVDTSETADIKLLEILVLRPDGPGWCDVVLPRLADAVTRA
ncbi:MAG: hypothetical protein ACXVX6_08620 [Mycobacterium sp.]